MKIKTTIQALLILALFLFLSIPSVTTHAAETFTVNTLIDEADGLCISDDCSLRDAIVLSSAGDTINFSVTGTITLTSEIVINKSLTITGPGAAQLTVSGNDLYRVFFVVGSVTVSISGLTIDRGYVEDGAGGGVGATNITSLILDQVVVSNSVATTVVGFPRGGGVGMDSGSLTITNSTITGNSAGYSGGGVAVFNSSSLIMTNVIVDNNHVVAAGSDAGGGISISSNPGYSSILTNVTVSNNSSTGSGGGIYLYTHELSLIQSTVKSNTAALNGGGLYISNSTANITGSTFNGNTTTGGSSSNGGAIHSTAASNINALTIENSTFSGNSAAGYGGALFNHAGGGVTASSTVAITNSTIVENIAANAARGGGIFAGNAGSGETSTVTLSNSIVYGNTLVTGTNGENCAIQNSSVINTNDNNLFQDLANDCVAGVTDVVSSNTLSSIVNALADNGGPTQTRALPATSIAVNAGNNATCETTDQRGVTRPQGAACDIGAFEYISPTTFTSVGLNDGWILESTETSGKGGLLNSTATIFNLGDDLADRQYRVILHFDTSSVPDNAVITSAVIKIKRKGQSGSNPFGILGELRMDMRKPAFGTAPLALNDFKSPATTSNAGTFVFPPVSNWYSAVLNNTGKVNINLIGTTQFRLRFAIDDNNDNGNDFMKFYSGNAGAANRPQLVIEYYVP